MLVIGVGNRWRRDDGVGIEVVERLCWLQPVEAELVATDDVLSLVDRWHGHDLVVVVDAVQSGAAAGTVHRIDATAAPLPAAWTFASSHQIGLAHAVEVGRAFERLPARLVIVGIEGEDFGIGRGLSPAVAGAVPEALGAVASYLPLRVA